MPDDDFLEPASDSQKVPIQGQGQEATTTATPETSVAADASPPLDALHGAVISDSVPAQVSETLHKVTIAETGDSRAVASRQIIE